MKKYKFVPITDFIREARSAIHLLTLNCVYYIVNTCYIGQTDINMFLHFNNVYSETPKLYRNAYNNSKSKAFNIVLSAILGSPTQTTSNYHDSVFMCLKKVLRFANLFNEEYIKLALDEFLISKDRPYVNKTDFKIVCMYLMINDQLELSVNTVAAYTNNKFNQLDYIYDEMTAICSLLDSLFISGFSVPNSRDNFHH